MERANWQGGLDPLVRPASFITNGDDMTAEPKKPAGLALLRVPFEAHQTSKLPKQAGWMADKKNEYRNCDVCGGWHHPKAVHLDYVGHAALTDRLLDADPEWNWEPVTTTETGVPKLDENGGMWIKLTVCGVTRLGYGHPDGKRGGDAVKEVIGDALRNAAMRFGAALDLWHKGDLHALDGDGTSKPEQPKAERKQAPPKRQSPHPDTSDMLDWNDLLSGEAQDGTAYEVGAYGKDDSKTVFAALQSAMRSAQTAAELAHWMHSNAAEIWKLNSAARHHLRERFDTLNEKLPMNTMDNA